MPKEHISQMSDGRSGLRVVHATPFDASEYHYAPELQKDKPKNNTGIKGGGMGGVKMNYQPSHKQPPNRSTRKLKDNKPPDYLNISEKPLPPVNEEIEKIVEADLAKRNIQPKRTKKNK